MINFSDEHFDINKLQGTWKSEVYDRNIYEFTIGETDKFIDNNFRVKALKTNIKTGVNSKVEMNEKLEERILFFKISYQLFIHINGFGYGFIGANMNDDNIIEIRKIAPPKDNEKKLYSVNEKIDLILKKTKM